MFCILESLLCKVALSLHLDIQGLRYVRHEDVYQLAHPEHQVLKYNHKCKLQSKNLPVDRSEGSLVVSESSVETFRLQILNC